MKLIKQRPLMRTVTSLIFCFSFVFILSCTDEKIMSCDGGSLDEVVKNDTIGQTNFQFLNVNVVPGTVYFSYPNLDEVRFSIGKTLNNVCPFSPILIKFNTTGINLDTSQNIALIARAEWHSLTSTSATTVINILDPVPAAHTYEGENEINVTDIFDNEPASIVLLVSVQFKRLNSFDDDRAFFLAHFKSLQIEATGQLFQ